MTHSSDSTKRWRMLLLVPVAVLAVLSIVATGGGGGDGGGGDVGDGGNGGGGGSGDIPPTILSTYNFEIGSQLADINLEAAGGSFQVEIDFGNTLLGSVNLDVSASDEVAFLSYVTDAGSTLSFTVSGTQTELDGAFTVDVTAPVNVDFAADNPTSGAFNVVAAGETVTVTVISTGVELSLNGGAAVSYAWQDYDDLLDSDTAATWERRASLAGGAFGFVFDLVFAVAETLGDLELATAGPVTASCDMFTGTPPAGVLPQGTSVLTWLGPGAELMPGAGFDWQFTDCWDADSFELANGLVQFSNYVQVIDASNTLTRIGFAPDSSVNGGISFFDWTVSFTDLNQGVFTINPADELTVNGGFSVVFQAP